MKKIVSVLLISAMLVTALTACDNKTSGDSSDNSSVTDNSSSSTTDNSETSSDDSSTEDSVSDPVDGSDDNNIVVPDDPDNPPGENEGADNSGLEYPDNKAGQMAKAALAVNVWPGMTLAEDQDMVDALFYDRGFVIENYDEYCISTNFISGQLCNVFVIKPKEGSESEVETVFDNYMEALKTDRNLTFYPAQEESAAGAVQGKTDDGYYYLIVHADGADIESEMLAAL